MVVMYIYIGLGLLWWAIERPSQYIATAAITRANNNTMTQPII